MRKLILLSVGLFFSLLWGQCLCAEEEIRLGVVAPLTGDFANYGTFIKDAVELAVSQQESDISVKVFYEDACLPKNAVTAFRKLSSVHKVHAIAGSYCVIGLDAFAPLANKDEVIVFHSSPIPTGVLNKSDFIFSTNVRTADEARKAARYAINSLKAKTSVLFLFDSQWGRGFSEPYREEFERLGGKIIGLETPPLEAPDFKAVLTKYVRNVPDVLFIADIAHRTGTIMKQARNLGITSQFLTVDEAEEENVLKVAGDAAEGTILFAPEPATLSSEQKIFRKEFEKRNGYAPNSLSASAYDATQLAIASLKKCNGESSCAKKELYLTRDYPGVSGDISIDSDGGCQKSFVKKKVIDSTFTRF